MKMKWQGARSPRPIAPARGSVMTRARVLHGSKFGAASKPRQLSGEERRAVEAQMRRDGQLSSCVGTVK
jgi:hypothetical protein